jgi:hypothetical protein
MEFDVPTQVKFFEGTSWTYGIAYGTEIICGCCGGIFEIDDIQEYQEELNEPVIQRLEWIDITDSIGGN